MCYDMVIDVLDQERQKKAQSEVLAKPKSPHPMPPTSVPIAQDQDHMRIHD